MADRASPPPGVRRIGRWTLRRPLGKGGMGQTWLVFEDTPSGHPRMGVMKLLLASNVGDEATQRRWADEVRVLTMLRGCPNIVQIDDIGVDDGLLYLVMEYIRGANLAELMRLARRAREVFSPELVAWIGGEIIIGIAAFQSLVVAGVPQNLCHLDINPNNILVSQGGVIKIADFGIAKRESDDRTNRGTTAYMAPEHYVGLPSQKSDVFCWGLLMWELLELKPYRDRSDAAALRRDLASREVKHLSVKGVPPELARLIYDCLEHDEAKRPSSDQVVLRLEKLVTHPLARRREIIEFMGDYVLDVRTSGATEMFEALPADPTPDLEGLMAANKVLRDQGNEVTLSAVFGPTPPRPPAATRGPSRGPRRAIGLHDDDGPLPPPLFGAPASDDVVPELGRQVLPDPAAEPAAVLSNTRPLPAAEQARIVAAVAAPPPNVGQPAAPAAPTPRLDRTTPLPPLGVESGAVAPRNERAAVPTMMAVAMPIAVPRTPVAMPVFAAPPIAQPSDPRRAVEAIDRGEAPQPMDADAHTPVPRAGGMRPPTEPSPGEGTDRVPSAEHASVLGIPRGRFAGWLAGGGVVATALGIGIGTWV
ncbi:MAG: protein kinase, partial [Myxococcales bacterium]|nr:protein kinase [Myxococcales bacterium]